MTEKELNQALIKEMQYLHVLVFAMDAFVQSYEAWCKAENEFPIHKDQELVERLGLSALHDLSVWKVLRDKE